MCGILLDLRKIAMHPDIIYAYTHLLVLLHRGLIHFSLGVALGFSGLLNDKPSMEGLVPIAAMAAS